MIHHGHLINESEYGDPIMEITGECWTFYMRRVGDKWIAKGWRDIPPDWAAIVHEAELAREQGREPNVVNV